MPREVNVTELQSSGVIGRGPIRMVGFILIAGTGGNADATIYYGRSTGTPTLGTLRAATAGVEQYDFRDGVVLGDGGYVDFGSNVAGVLVLWQHDSDLTGG